MQAAADQAATDSPFVHIAKLRLQPQRTKRQHQTTGSK
jgi:hypothetical protein